ncbi:MAG: gliding motility lipoprotein GldH [Christiangramia sp.]|uniref:GldH n=1 Tax=Christiangramia flava JLT2011 TaxID=1229726 RepID=A0A1L7I4L9_9FLAO|nr:gliding motility lipoprotein GldH [Christiangramia flava]APU68042.1 GldH [Christiangramia flava JLT2011]MAM17631.1 gliding motility lipoprotein GldH [Christiangramia sp.]OSS40544.1 GldH [Christiangramia flava JLT2011]|tara:strand:+ start:127 stop:621 length:495 start_codon:yes stop_codon:yes gene_type:complete
MHKLCKGSLLILSLVLLISCDKKRVYDAYESVGNWHKDSLVSFKIEDIDTTKQYNLFLNIRNDNRYAYSNLFLITRMHFPEGKVITDTLEYEMAKPDGEWLGTGFGDVKESKLWYKENVRFDEAGEYTIDIQQAMRKNGETTGIEELKGITDVGFRIEKATTNN